MSCIFKTTSKCCLQEVYHHFDPEFDDICRLVDDACVRQRMTEPFDHKPESDVGYTGMKILDPID